MTISDSLYLQPLSIDTNNGTQLVNLNLDVQFSMDLYTLLLMAETNKFYTHLVQSIFRRKYSTKWIKILDPYVDVLGRTIWELNVTLIDVGISIIIFSVEC